MPTLWIANLDAELHWQAPAGTPPTLPRRLRSRLAAVGSLFRFLAEEGDALWLPAPIERARLSPDAGPAQVVTGSPKGVLERFAGHRVRAWAEAPPWIAGAAAAVAARVNDRRFALELARRLGVADERAARVSSPEAAIEHAREHGVERWVVKAPLSASGRRRHVHLGGPPEASRAPVEKLLARHGELVFEPWHERLCDVGVLFDCPLKGEPSCHLQVIGASGAVRALELDFDMPAPLLETARRVAGELAGAGYRGPAGIDAWLHVDGGERRWHVLGEINARWSVGHLLRAVARRPGGGAFQAYRRLEIGDQGQLDEARESRAQLQCLVHPSPGEPGLWLV